MKQHEFEKELHNKNLRVTPQRVCVYMYLDGHHTHPTADEIYSALKSEHINITRATVYNVLEDLVKAELISVVHADGVCDRYDAFMGLHGHFRCRICGCVFDFTVDKLEVNGLNGFETLRKDVLFEGVCNKCKKSL